jgi:hypothetical protein
LPTDALDWVTRDAFDGVVRGASVIPATGDVAMVGEHESLVADGLEVWVSVARREAIVAAAHQVSPD